ncbi:MAG: lactate racemase domain-containing protein, partial [Aigarchaeota archaeon]|nr:lactate racemase domain-containing protein [Aigarchaeota archaeon]
MRITLPYGRETVPLYLDKKQLIGVFSPVEVTGVPDASDELGRSMANPVGCEGLQSLISAGKKVAIAVDDNTRVTPVQSILTVLLEQMKSLGVKREDVVI